MDTIDILNMLVTDTERLEMAARAKRRIAKILSALPDDQTRELAIGRVVTRADAAQQS